MFRRLLLPFALFALVVGACGGGSDDRLTKAEFIAAADAACAEYDEAVDALPEPQSEAELVTLLESGRALLVELKDDLAALEPPADDEEAIDELFGTLDEMLDAVDTATEKADDGDTEGMMTALESVDDLSDATDEGLQDYGFEVCGADDDESDEVADGEFDTEFDIDDYPSVYEPTDDEVAVLSAELDSQFGGVLEAESLDCISRFVLERATLEDMDGPLGEKLGEAAALECLSIDELVEIGSQQ